MHRWVAILVLACAPEPLVVPDAGGVGFASCGEMDEPASPCRKTTEATSVEVVDGDTLDVVHGGGGTVRVRLIGIDAPEHGEGECGTRAEIHLTTLVPPGSLLRLVFDAECHDAYGRDLSYVFVDGTSVNAAMVRDGYAQACPFEPNTTSATVLRCLEERAIAEGKGLWALGCNRDGCFSR